MIITTGNLKLKNGVLTIEDKPMRKNWKPVLVALVLLGLGAYVAVDALCCEGVATCMRCF